MPRTSPGAVEGILGGHYDGSTPLTPFIDTAASLVDKVVAANVTLGVLSASDPELIERWLAAHFYGHSDQFMTSKSTGRASGSFQGQTAMVFNSTQYGQAALALDATGTLAAIQQQAEKGRMRIGMRWLGTRHRNDHSQRAVDQ